MQRRSAGPEVPAEFLRERLASVIESGLPVDDKLRHIEVLRAAVPAVDIDRCLVEWIGQLYGGLQSAQEKQLELTEMLEKLGAQPYFPAIYQNIIDSENGPSAVVRLGSELRVVALGDAVAADELTPGDEVLLATERNVIVGKSSSSCFDCGEIATFSRLLPGGRCVVKVRDDEFVVVANAALRASGLVAGDQVRIDRTFGLAFEKVARSNGNEFFLQDTPQESFAEIGGLDKQIDQIQRIFALHCFHGDIVRKYRHKAKRSVCSMVRVVPARPCWRARWLIGWRRCRSTAVRAS
jgi:hypothetical protein